MTERMHYNKNSHYKENISSILITEDNSTLVVIGKKYHYVLKNVNKIATIIKSDLHEKCKLQFVDANIDMDNQISGWLKVIMQNPSKNEISEAIKYGFVKDNSNMALEFKLNGTRYLAGAVAPAKKYLLNEQYSISVSEPESGMKKALKIAATPITVAIDGALFLAHAPGLVLLLTFEDLR